MIRVLLLASHPLVRSGLENLAHAASLQVSRSVEERGQLSEAIAEGQPEVVIVAWDSRDTDRLPTEFTTQPGLLLLDPHAAAESPDSWTGAVRGILRQDTSAPELASAVGAVAAGLTVFHPEYSASLLEPSGNAGMPVMPSPEESLTPREVEVLRLLAEGESNKAIAYRLNISEHTVKFHVASILGKLGAGTRTEAVMRGVRRGLVML